MTISVIFQSLLYNKKPAFWDGAIKSGYIFGKPDALIGMFIWISK